MFSGIIEALGTVSAVEKEGTNLHITLSCPFANELQIDQSVAHNGVCLTVVNINDNEYTVTAIQETLEKSNTGLLKVGNKVNLERSMRMNGRLDGHIVQGHVDTIAECKSVKEEDGSWLYQFRYKISDSAIKKGLTTVEKGSITVNGVSLTVVNSEKDSFKVAIIPYTHEHTNFHTFEVGTKVNLEFDIIGKYIAKMHNL